MKTILATLILFSLTSFAQQKPVAPTSTNVYICNSKNAPKYHLKSNCKGLTNCSYKTKKITLNEAKKMGRTLCRWEMPQVKKGPK